ITSLPTYFGKEPKNLYPSSCPILIYFRLSIPVHLIYYHPIETLDSQHRDMAHHLSIGLLLPHCK
ncbi:MAG TPA: hypothetical protein PKE52_08820, partial [Bacteroidales bacterium]|nr:hypothetical protein [Bacteroidales bacterium]